MIHQEVNMQEEPVEEVASTSPAEPEPSGQEEKPPSRRERFGRSVRRLLRWLVVLLVIFGLGVLAAALLLYLPARDQLRQSENRHGEALQQIEALQTQVAGLSSLESANQTLQADAEQAQLHLQILSARADVSAAQLALAQRDQTRARMALSKTSQTLTGLGEMLDPEQEKIVTDMQERLKLALSELNEDAFAAQADLGVLANSLTELENAYFAAP
jgi:hypothetical protein